VPGSLAQDAATVGLSFGYVPSELDALRALEAVLKQEEFWTPEVLGALQPELMEAFLWARIPKVVHPELEEMIGLRGRSAWDRAVAAKQVLRSDRMRTLLKIAPGHLVTPDLRALSWAAGLPYELPHWIQGDTSVNCSGEALRWLPDDLHVPGDLLMDRCPIKSLPYGLEVKRDLHIEDCELLENVNGIVKVGDCIHAGGSPLAKWAVEEVQAHFDYMGSFYKG
jgi:hypothetical protein